jgi:hypothetical protein
MSDRGYVSVLDYLSTLPYCIEVTLILITLSWLDYPTSVTLPLSSLMNYPILYQLPSISYLPWVILSGLPYSSYPA